MPFLRLSMLSFDMVISSLPLLPGSNRLEATKFKKSRFFMVQRGPRIQNIELQSNSPSFLFHLHSLKLTVRP